MPGPRLGADGTGMNRQESPHDELKGSELLNFTETFQAVAGEHRTQTLTDRWFHYGRKKFERPLFKIKALIRTRKVLQGDAESSKTNFYSLVLEETATDELDINL